MFSIIVSSGLFADLKTDVQKQKDLKGKRDVIIKAIENAANNTIGGKAFEEFLAQAQKGISPKDEKDLIKSWNNAWQVVENAIKDFIEAYAKDDTAYTFNKKNLNEIWLNSLKEQREIIIKLLITEISVWAHKTTNLEPLNTLISKLNFYIPSLNGQKEILESEIAAISKSTTSRQYRYVLELLTSYYQAFYTSLDKIQKELIIKKDLMTS
jgi:hypothetical protein